MKLNIKATNIVLTDATREYFAAKLEDIERLVTDPIENVWAEVELGKETQHHRHGNIFRAEIKLHLPGRYLYTKATEADLYTAIDQMKDEIIGQLKNHYEKKSTLLRRGGRLAKNIFRGFYIYPLKGLKRLRRKK